MERGFGHIHQLEALVIESIKQMSSIAASPVNEVQISHHGVRAGCFGNTAPNRIDALPPRGTCVRR